MSRHNSTFNSYNIFTSKMCLPYKMISYADIQAGTISQLLVLLWKCYFEINSSSVTVYFLSIKGRGYSTILLFIIITIGDCNYKIGRLSFSPCVPSEATHCTWSGFDAWSSHGNDLINGNICIGAIEKRCTGNVLHLLMRSIGITREFIF